MVKNRYVAGSIWSEAKSRSKSKTKAKARRDETRARGELGREAKTDIGGRETTSFILRERAETGTYRRESEESE